MPRRRLTGNHSTLVRQAAPASLRALIWAALLLLLPLGCAPEAEETWQRIEEQGVLHVGLDPTYPPFAVANGENVRGLDVDLVRAVAGELGLEVEFTYFGYDGLYEALETGQVDVLVSALVIWPQRTRDFAYTDPYFNGGQILVVPAGEKEIEEMRDLANRRVAVELGSEGHMVANQWQQRVRGMAVNRYESAEAALDAVTNRQADAAVVDHVSARLYLANRDGLKRAGEPVTVEPYAMVVRIEDDTLLQRLDESLDRLQTSGRLAEIQARWLDHPR